MNHSKTNTALWVSEIEQYNVQPTLAVGGVKHDSILHGVHYFKNLRPTKKNLKLLTSLDLMVCRRGLNGYPAQRLFSKCYLQSSATQAPPGTVQ